MKTTWPLSRDNWQQKRPTVTGDSPGPRSCKTCFLAMMPATSFKKSRLVRDRSSLLDAATFLAKDHSAVLMIAEGSGRNDKHS